MSLSYAAASFTLASSAISQLNGILSMLFFFSFFFSLLLTYITDALGYFLDAYIIYIIL
jgi:hypothetical protein